MNLVASLVVRNELGRYLPACIEHLRAFCDLVVVLDDGSDDGTEEWLAPQQDQQVRVHRWEHSAFYVHEGHTRTQLLQHALALAPTHVLPLDADELIGNGRALRAMIEARPNVPAWHLPIHEVWAATEDRYFTREDGGWPRGRTLVWRVPKGPLSFKDAALACGRVPQQVARLSAQHTKIPLLHLGWLDESERQERVARYTEHDGGRFHARSHLASILDARQVKLEGRTWPPALAPWRDAIIEHASPVRGMNESMARAEVGGHRRKDSR